MKRIRKGFTLIELLIVIAIIAILATVVFVALNPPKRFQDSRNARRTADVQSILTAVHQSIVDNGGAIPVGISTTEQQLGSCAASTQCGVVTACSDMSTVLAAYLKTLPKDPSLASASTETGYSVIMDANNIITVRACMAEGAGVVIQASR